MLVCPFSKHEAVFFSPLLSMHGSTQKRKREKKKTRGTAAAVRLEKKGGGCGVNVFALGETTPQCLALGQDLTT